jgi:hypothetical protein
MHKIEIIKSGPESFTVETWLERGYVDKTHCTSQDQALTYARGVAAGLRLGATRGEPDPLFTGKIIER